VDVSENLIHTREDVSTPPPSSSSSSSSSSSDELQDSSRMPTPIPPKQAPKSDPPGRLDGILKNHKSCISLLQRKPRLLHKDVECVYGNISRKKRDLFVRLVVLLSIQNAAKHDIIH
jgi:hypothetical protein